MNSNEFKVAIVGIIQLIGTDEECSIGTNMKIALRTNRYLT